MTTATSAKSAKARQFESPSRHTEPDWPTTVRGVMPGGRILGIDGSMWVYYRVPLGPVADAKSVMDGLKPGGPINNAFEELAAMTPVRLARRGQAKSSYRRVHMMLVNLPGSYHVGQPGALAAYLSGVFANKSVTRRILLFGVRLVPQMGSGGMRSAIDSIVEFLVTQGTPLSDFEKDFARISGALARSGMSVPTADEISLVKSWWSTTRNPASANLAHPSHVHIFDTAAAAQTAARHGVEDCTQWPEMSGHYQATIASMSSLELGFRPAVDGWTRWVDALRNENLLALSIHGLAEPATVTRAELRRRHKQYLNDINERLQQGKMTRAEQEEMTNELGSVEEAYATGGPPTLIEASVLVALNGGREDLSKKSSSAPYKLNEMAYNQSAGMEEMQLASPMRANPHLHDLPAHTIAFSGIASLSVVGDKNGAQMGFTQLDRQPAFISATQANSSDGPNITLIVGQTGSGKTVLLQWLAFQFAKNRRPQVIFDPKLQSNLDGIVLASGGRIASLDSLISADGVLDPLRFSSTPEAAADEAANMLMFVNPWGSKAQDYYTPLLKALRTGINNGATCIGQALRITVEKGAVPTEVVQPVFDLAESSPLFRACVGMNPDAPTLRMFDGLTYIKVGNSPLSMPDEKKDPSAYTPSERSTVNLIRMVTLGSVRALAGRGGVLHLDEGWTVLGTGSGIAEVGRTARSLGVQVMIYTQKGVDGTEVGVDSHVSRMILLPMNTERDARHGLGMVGLEATDERLAALTAGAEDGDGPNWHSMRALRDPNTKRVLRGTVGFYSDLKERAIPVEIVVPPEVMRIISTNPDDILAGRIAEGSQVLAQIVG